MQAQIMVVMNSENTFLISFSGLKNGNHEFEFQVDTTFFKSYNYEDFNSINADIVVLLNKKSTLLELYFSFKGTVNTPCDVTNQDFDMPIEGELKLIVKFGETFDDDHDEILIIPFSEHQIDVAQYIYELVALSIPQKRVHPGVLDGSLKSEALKYLGYYEEENDLPEKEKENKEEIDPRWEKLKKLLTDK